MRQALPEVRGDFDGEKLRRLRESAGLNETQVAAAVGTTSQSVKNWERGENWPKLRYYFRLCELLANGDLEALREE